MSDFNRFTLVYAQFPRYSRPTGSFPVGSVTGKKVYPTPGLPGFVAIGMGGGHGHHNTTFKYLTPAQRERYVYEVAELNDVMAAWLEMEGCELQHGTNKPTQKRASLIEDDLIPLLSMFLEVTQNE